MGVNMYVYTNVKRDREKKKDVHKLNYHKLPLWQVS